MSQGEFCAVKKYTSTFYNWQKGITDEQLHLEDGALHLEDWKLHLLRNNYSSTFCKTGLKETGKRNAKENWGK